MKIQKESNAIYNFEYNCRLRRIYPWNGVVQPAWGSAIAKVDINCSTTIHHHDEKETFIILHGYGEITIDDEREMVQTGDVIYLPPMSSHTIKNISETEELKFLTIYWDEGMNGTDPDKLKKEESII